MPTFPEPTPLQPASALSVDGPTGWRGWRRRLPRALLAAACTLTCGAALAGAELPAFPGALGYGRDSAGWRNGRIVYVTNLHDDGPGSLRACATLVEPRVCLFAVSGTIVVDRPIKVRPNVYIAGQTAPAQGVQLRLGKAESTPLIVKNSHDVVLRFLKFRPGPSATPSATVSGLLIMNSHDVIVDHCSMQFATDQTFTVHYEGGSVSDVTLQRSIVAYGLDHSNHPKGRHSKGPLICSGPPSARHGPHKCGRVTLAENVVAHNRDRNPDISGTDLGPIQVINNIFYNPISQFGEFYDAVGSPAIDYVGNLTITGPSSRKNPSPVPVETFDFTPDERVRLYTSGNLFQAGRKPARPAEARLAEPAALSDTPHSDLGTPLPAARLEAELLPSVGARFPDGRMEDALDRDVIRSVVERSGRVIDEPGEAGGWPDLPVASGPSDRDGDGLPDAWETARSGLDPDARSDTWQDRDGDGWSNIEEYLSKLAGDRASR